MALNNYQPDPKFFKELAVGDEIRSACREIADKAKGIAEALSQDFRITGDYADSFSVQETTIAWTGTYPGPRAAAQLVNTSDHAAAVEWGNAHDHKPHHVLGRTLAALDD